jgi:hypothetical protein
VLPFAVCLFSQFVGGGTHEFAITLKKDASFHYQSVHPSSPQTLIYSKSDQYLYKVFLLTYSYYMHPACSREFTLYMHFFSFWDPLTLFAEEPWDRGVMYSLLFVMLAFVSCKNLPSPPSSVAGPAAAEMDPS